MIITTPVLEASRTDAIRVLLVEDSIDHQMLVRRSLERAGYEVVVASSGEAALEALAGDVEFHLALIDQGLPRMSGTELLAHVVAMPGGPGAVMVTASADAKLVVKSLRAGAVDFVSKQAGYLDVLPAVVERAHRQWDLRQRTRELQRVALLVHGASGLEETVGEVVDGICRLLRAPNAVLMLHDDEAGSWRPGARTGDEAELTTHVARDLAQRRTEDVEQREGLLVVRLPAELDEQAGALVVQRDAAQPFVAEEEELAKTFAAFASLALRQARRAELEGGLIEELQQTIRARRDFVASVSHELRTPLTSIGGYAETIQRHRDQLEPAAILDLVDRIGRHAGDLERLIDQLIDVAKIERGARFVPTMAALSLDGAIADAVEAVEQVLVGREVSTDVPAVEINGDPDFLNRIMANLLTNAVKYSEPGTPIWIEARADASRVEIVVRDVGIGIDPNETVLAFQPFWRAGHAVGQAVRGMGIGLSLVREYVTAMSGEVGCRPGPEGVGSEFWFHLPLAGVSVE